MKGVIHYAIPPHGWTEAEAFQKELRRIQDVLGTRIEGFRSPKEVADFLNTLNLRPTKLITEEQVKQWCRTRGFPCVRRALCMRWYTTSAHVLAWLWTYATYAPFKRRLRGAA